MPRAMPPRKCATPSQTAATPRPTWVNSRAIGPGPERTARGAGRRAVVERLLEERTGFFLLPVLRAREVEPPVALLVEVLRDVLVLREPGGEDVRVAMVFNLSHSHTSHMDHRCVSPQHLESGAGTTKSKILAMPRSGVSRPRLLLTGMTMAALLWSGCTPGPGEANTAAARLTVRIAAALDGQFATGSRAAISYDQLRAVLVTVGGRPVFQRYTDTTSDGYWDLHSATRSVMAMLVGVAVADGDLALDDTLATLLPAYAEQMSPRVAHTTLQRVLTVAATYSPDQVGGVSDFTAAADWTSAILRSPFTMRGQEDRYADAGAQLLSPILEQATGQRLLDYARTRLFDPLDIDTRAVGFAWPTDPQGHAVGWSLLKLRPRDLATLGQLFLDDGVFEGRQVLPATWVEESSGYMWWLRRTDDDLAYAVIGYGGQVVEVVPSLDLVVVFTTAVDLADVADYGIDPEVLLALVESSIAPVVRT